MNDAQKEMYETLSQLTGEKVVNLFLDYLGLQILDDGFKQHLINEDILPDEEKNEYAELSVSDTDDFDEFCDSYEKCYNCPVYQYKSSESNCKQAFKELKEKEQYSG